MKIHNVRLGFATNSSSTHSLIFLRGAGDDDVGDAQFGWDFFTAASKDAKSDYLAITLRDNLRHFVSEDIADVVVNAWVGKKDLEDGSVDHQSMMTLPRTWDEKGIDRAFFDDFSRFMLRDDIAILGGNDNTDEKHSLDDGTSFELPLERDGGSSFVARKDGKSGWTLFNRDTGAKIRLSFDAPRDAVAPTKSSAPELVDLKITDFCESGCSYCYQGSTPAGKHASSSTIDSIAWTLSKMKVFEVAIGGGEPTTHPQFSSILWAFRRNGVVPNFTTRSLEWLDDPAKSKEILRAMGGFAFSVDSAKDIVRLAEALKKARVGHNGHGSTKQVNVQYVMGAHDLSRLDEIVEACHEHSLVLVLLGYKRTGRGESRPPKPYAGWVKRLQAIAKNKWLRIGVDTALAAESEAEIKLAAAGGKNANLFYTTEEGKFSMYIDAVAGKMGPSSYCEPLRMRPVVAHDAEHMLEAYAGW